MTFMLSAETFNNTADVTSYIELIAVMEAISNMDMKKHLEAFRSLNIGQAQNEIDGDEGESVDNKDLAKHVVAIPQLVELFVRMPCTFVL